MIPVLLTLLLASASLGAPGLAQNEPFSEPLVGIDVSHHQGEIDWTAVARNGIKFVYMKSSEGQDFGDRMFRAQLDQRSSAVDSSWGLPLLHVL